MSETIRQLLHTSSHIGVPVEVGMCPYCDRPLSIGFEDFERNDVGTWSCIKVELECATELEMQQYGQHVTEDDWDQFERSHSLMPYVYILPVEERILEWVNQSYYFDCEGEEEL